MKQNQIDQVKGHLEEFMSEDLSGRLAKSFGDQTELAGVEIGEYSASEYLSTAKRVFDNLIEQIDSVYAKALPFQYQFGNEYGSGNLHQDLGNFLNQIRVSNFVASVPQLNRLVHYQAVNGFWDKQKTTSESLDGNPYINRYSNNHQRCHT